LASKGFTDFVPHAWRRMRCRMLLGLGVFPMLPLAGCATPGQSGLTAEQQALNVQSFERAWELVRDRHWDPALNGLDWQAVHDEIKPQVEAAESMDEARGALRRMVAKLGQSHFSIIPGDLVDEADDVAPDELADDGDASAESGEMAGDAPQPKKNDPGASPKSRDAVTGLHIQVAGGKVFVVSIDQDTPAEEAGVEVGWEITKVGDAEVTTIAEGLKEVAKAEEMRPAQVDGLLRQMVARRLQGPGGEKVTATFANAGGQSQVIAFELVEQPGRPVKMGFLPPFYLKFEAERIGPSIGYIAFNCFFDPAFIMPKFGEAVTSFADADGIIIDLRGNPGGIGALAIGMAGWFVNENNLKLGTMIMRDTTLNFVINRRAKSYMGPLAILIDSGTASTAEIFSGGMKDLGRARIFGQPSAGAALPSHVEKLPNGDSFLFAVANYVSEGGEELEGNGVIPDEEVTPSEDDLRNGRDVVLDAAIRWIAENEPSVASSVSTARGNERVKVESDNLGESQLW
jgi:carboxyl-terminal processing protease